MSHAFHSPLVEPVLDELGKVAGSVEYRRPGVPLVSTVTGSVVSDEVCSAAYWVEQARRTVRFADAVQTAVGEDLDIATFVGIGPDGQLAALAQDVVDGEVGSGGGGERDVRCVGTLRAGRDEGETFLTALAEAWVRGVPVDWRPVFAGTGARLVELPTYAFQHRRYWPAIPSPSATSDPGGWRYRVAWRPLAAEATEPRLSGRWLVVTSAGMAGMAGMADEAGEDDEVGAWCAQALVDHGAEVVSVAVGPDLDRGALAAQVMAAVSGGPVNGVLSLVGMDDAPLAPSTSASGPVGEGGGGSGTSPDTDASGSLRETGVAVGVGASLVVGQALVDGGVTAPLWCVTRGGVGTGTADPVHSPWQAQVWALGRVLALEAPQRWGGLVDLPDTLDARAAESLCGVLAGSTGEDQVALRPAEPAASWTDDVLVRRLERISDEAPTGDPKPWVGRGTALVTGGTGVLGGHVARWLAGNGVDHVVLVSRRGAEADDVAELVAEIEGRGAEVTVVACDVADREALAEVVANLPAAHPLRTVVHTAGVGVGGDLDDMAVDDLVEASAAKVLGAVHLDELTADLDLDAFVLFSSGAAVWGGGGQGVYAAANAFVDALAEQRRARGRPATSVAWGPWAGRGMAEGSTGERLLRSGVREMPPVLALAALRQVLDGDEPCVAVADIDWERFAPSFSAARRRPLIEDLPEAARALGLGPGLHAGARPGEGPAAATDPATTDPATEAETQLVRQLAGLGDDERRRALVDVVRTEVAAVLGHADPGAVAPDRALKEMGLDSVTGVELRNRLGRLTGLRLPATLVYDHPTTGALARELADRLRPERASPAEEALDHLARMETALTSLAADEQALATLRTGLRRLLSKATSPGAGSGRSGNGHDASRQVEEAIHAADDDELLRFIDRELGNPDH